MKLSNLKGNTIWKQLEKSKVCSGNRTWQSMKEQFRKVFFDLYSSCLFQPFVTQVIVHKIESFGLTRKELLKFREGLGIASNLVICLWTCEPGIGGAGKSKTMRSEAGAVNSS